MSAPVFLAEASGIDRLAAGDHYLLDGPEGRHAGVVQRRRPGEAVDVVDGDGVRARCTIESVHESQVRLAVDEVVTVIAEHAARGIPVLFSSHQLDVVERLCDDLVIIAGGEIRAAGSREELRAAHSGDRYELVTTSDAGWVRAVPGVVVDELAAGTVVFRSHKATAEGVLRTAVGHGGVNAFRPLQPTLGEIFREIVVDSATTNEEDAA